MKTCCTFFLFCSMTFQLFGQSWQYNNNRIAISFDGNSAADTLYKWPFGDPDDWGAAAASLAIIAKMKFQKKLVHCSYNNFIDAPAGPDSQNQLKISLEGGAKRWGFNKAVLFDVTTQLDEAKRNLAAEMAKSTASDPLYFMHAGLAEFVYQAVALVAKSKDSTALSHVYVLSHSGFNEIEKRRTYHHNWADIMKLSGNRLQYKKIKDQNNKNNPNDLWHSGTDFSVWYWMRDHPDPNIRWMYTRMQAHSGGVADISDCGLLYFLLVGDDNGTPEKFKNFIGEGITKAQKNN